MSKGVLGYRNVEIKAMPKINIKVEIILIIVIEYLLLKSTITKKNMNVIKSILASIDCTTDGTINNRANENLRIFSNFKTISDYQQILFYCFFEDKVFFTILKVKFRKILNRESCFKGKLKCFLEYVLNPFFK